MVVTLKDILPKYRPSVYNLKNLLRNNELVLDMLADVNERNVLASEVVMMTLLCSKSGSSMLEYYMSNIDTIDDYKTSENSIYKKNTALALRWENNDVLLIKFLTILLSNRKTLIKFTTGKDDTLSKNMAFAQDLRFLFNKHYDETSYLPAAIVKSEQFDYLEAYCSIIWPKIKNILLESLNIDKQFQDVTNSFFHKIIKLYKREYLVSAEFLTLINVLTNSVLFSYIVMLSEGYISSNYDGLLYKSPPTYNVKQRENMMNSFGEFQSSAMLTNDENNSIDLMKLTERRQNILYKVLIFSKLKQIEPESFQLMSLLFNRICALVDPLTQPIPNDEHVISLDLLYKIFLAMMLPHVQVLIERESSYDWRYEISNNLQKILFYAFLNLNCYDMEKLNKVDETKHWKEQLHLWLPHGLNPQNLELLYMICIFCVYAIFKLYEDKPLHFNPFLPTLLSTWKKLTYVMLYGLQVDRFEEENESFNTPIMVRATIRGASALRSVVASILNNQMDGKKHDFQHEPLNTFMSPHGRKLCTGALYADLKSYTASMLACGMEFKDITELLSYLQPGDCFDEDVKYMFEYEYDDYNEPEEDESDEDGERNNSEENIKFNFNRRRCRCVFSDDDVLEHGDFNDANSEYSNSEENSNDVDNFVLPNDGIDKPKNGVEFDFDGKDWRAVPRHLNMFYSFDYIFIENPLEVLIRSLISEASASALSKKKSHLLLRNIASVIKINQDSRILGSKRSPNGTDSSKSQNGLSTGDLIKLITAGDTFENILKFNRELGCFLMDELLMILGYRRVLLWFLTHLTLSHTIIYYIFELLMHHRGQVSDTEREQSELSYTFSRQGELRLSDLEREMLLQEFFTNATMFFSSKSVLFASDTGDNNEINTDVDGEEGLYSLYAVGLMRVTCIMIISLFDNADFDLSSSESIFELQTLLMGWINIIPEAKLLFFKLKESVKSFNGIDNPELKSIEESSTTTKKTTIDENSEQYRFNKKLLKTFPKSFSGDDGDILLKTFKDFLRNYSFDSEPPYIGRKVIYESDEILQLTDIEKPISLHKFLSGEQLYDVDIQFDYGDKEA
ncbi:hypothetical protein TPHA_0A05680 [Tetrapisispora phaffii CBS 4417]|uniref:Uncharacterized protein n=1 Tax=Tetrapisispora phaffii (strain ATCC 24235 / CBS 4417 / NBRC 1672 / NRRL Y-8282 / UCD 70-5) TaxID=1071381 RepID=G8BP14_TETPH|nr:hypothetical protein TPHA_0A05680 [Tetrapisispora phaffii CBS 4417]CCE61642.1 hypothetical protein TPHA_0A05680 [Tetrapisispora phaffii CBS 4417]